ncbi:LLM class flavin-dependent oxidoreductase [Planotetraspora phitsanulokensis]|uniref:N5,N10-methylene tetrahydromethanopterin reductase n=1 Tax=Planotetraspora phitsanulokensis TaxID=575192 RepID=A0A8J3U4C3_9ACTN|nr:LLM class flavin-dependent oxidoreductase [Planotetraspora phitsanulokensis]GII37975.1 N5,N10-methylene tetrahydromethanopterin reductase [Planotetraspora phitsanulokensis]
MTKHFRFGVVAGFAPDAQSWTGLARQAEDLGYSTLLVPDTLGTLPPLLALAAAAGATTTLRLSTFVLSVPYRRPRQLAWELAGLDFLSGGRLDLGIGTGRADARADTEFLGMPYGSAGERLSQVEELITEVRTAFGGSARFTGAVQKEGPPVLLAAAGERMLTLAAREADIVTFALHPATAPHALHRPLAVLEEKAGDRFGEIELSSNVHLVGSDPPPWLRPLLHGAGPGSLAVLDGSPREMADTLLRRRDEFGISYVTVNGVFAQAFAPVVELLAGR